MIEEREAIITNISRMLAITKYDIEQRQSISDYNLNIHAENWIRDIYNFIYGLKLENANFKTQNIACVDLIDKKNKKIYQITSTRSKEKIEKTLIALNNPLYNGYKIGLVYLLEKSSPNKDTVRELSEKYSIELEECLFDSSDLFKDINNLNYEKLKQLNEIYFKGVDSKYTDEIILNLVCKHIVSKQPTLKHNYDDFMGNIDTNKKIEINEINPRIALLIQYGLDYSSILEGMVEGNIIEKLRVFIVDEIYKKILIHELSSVVSKEQYYEKSILELHDLARKNKLDFSKIINNLHLKIEENFDIKDFNSLNIGWIIIAYFFELCDIGVKK